MCLHSMISMCLLLLRQWQVAIGLEFVDVPFLLSPPVVFDMLAHHIEILSAAAICIRACHLFNFGSTILDLSCSVIDTVDLCLRLIAIFAVMIYHLLVCFVARED